MQTSSQATAGAVTAKPLSPTGCHLSRISPGEGKNSHTVVAVFAHNAAESIRGALESVVPAADVDDVSVFVLAYGCADATVDVVRSCSGLLPNLWLVEIPSSDKANAWNIFIHELFSDAEARGIHIWYLVDGSVTLTPNAISVMSHLLDQSPDADAAGGLPGSGRDMEAWRRRMVVGNSLAANFYALRDRLVNNLRGEQIRMPTGLIGEEFVLSWMIEHVDWGGADEPRGSHCVYSSAAEFLFRSLSPLRLSDYRTYFRRKWQHTLRGLQQRMLINLLIEEGLTAMPTSVEELYRRAPLPARARFLGLLREPLQALAIRRIRLIQNMPEARYQEYMEQVGEVYAEGKKISR